MEDHQPVGHQVTESPAGDEIEQLRRTGQEDAGIRGVHVQIGPAQSGYHVIKDGVIATRFDDHGDMRVGPAVGQAAQLAPRAHQREQYQHQRQHQGEWIAAQHCNRVVGQ